MLKTDFAQEVKGKNGDLLMKLLRESILEELKLGGHSATLSDVPYESRPGSREIDAAKWVRLDPEGKYNLDHLNNENAIGYNKLEERARNPEDNHDIAHESVFDKLVAKYFLEKRSDYKDSN